MDLISTLKKSNAFITGFFLLLLSAKSVSQDCNDALKSGEGTYYTGVDGGEDGNCSLFVDSDDFYHAALNPIDYNGSNACGACIEVTGPLGAVQLQVVDSCPECKDGDVDMTQEAFSEIAAVIDGRVPIEWKFVPCFLSNDAQRIKIHFKKESEKYWTAVQFRNINHPVKVVSFLSEDNTWELMNRESYNYFIKDGGIPSPMNLKITSIFDEELVFEEVEMVPDEEIETSLQFTTPERCLDDSSVDEVKEELPLVYPNPTNGMIYMSNFKINEWFLADLKGRVLKKGKDNMLNMATFSKGVYLLELNDMQFKLIKE